jgi:hypothetical protein
MYKIEAIPSAFPSKASTKGQEIIAKKVGI